MEHGNFYPFQWKLYETQTRFSLNLVPESYTPFGLVYPAVVAGCSPARDVNGRIFFGPYSNSIRSGRFFIRLYSISRYSISVIDSYPNTKTYIL